MKSTTYFQQINGMGYGQSYLAFQLIAAIRRGLPRRVRMRKGACRRRADAKLRRAGQGGGSHARQAGPCRSVRGNRGTIFQGNQKYFLRGRNRGTEKVVDWICSVTHKSRLSVFCCALADYKWTKLYLFDC